MGTISVHLHEDPVRRVSETPEHQRAQRRSPLRSAKRLRALDQMEIVTRPTHPLLYASDRPVGAAIVEYTDREGDAGELRLDPVEDRADVVDFIEDRQ